MPQTLRTKTETCNPKTVAIREAENHPVFPYTPNNRRNAHTIRNFRTGNRTCLRSKPVCVPHALKFIICEPDSVTARTANNYGQIRDEIYYIYKSL